MESLVLKVGDGLGAVELDTADVQPTWEVLKDGDGRRIGEKMVWRCKAFMRAEDSASLKAERDKLLDALRQSPLSIRLLSDGSEIDALKTAFLDEGPHFGEMEFGTSDESDLRSRALVSFSVYGCLFDKEGDVLASKVKTEYIRDEKGFLSKRVYGSIRVRDGASAYLAALRYQPALSAFTHLKKRTITVSESGMSAEFEFIVEEVAEEFPAGVDFCRRIVEETEEGGIRRTVYEAEFAGDGAAAAAGDFLMREDATSKEKIEENESGLVKVRYVKEEPIGGDVVLFRRLRLSGGQRRLKASHTKGNKTFIFWGEKKPLSVEFEEEKFVCNTPLRLSVPQTPDTLLLKEKELSVEPYLVRSDGEVLGWKLKWRLKYLSRNITIDEATLMSMLMQR